MLMLVPNVFWHNNKLGGIKKFMIINYYMNQTSIVAQKL